MAAQAIAQNLLTLSFVLSSMVVMGMSLTVTEIVEPIRRVRLVAMAFLVSFVVVPFVAVLVQQVLPLNPEARIGLILLATAHGGPFTPRLAQIARGNLAFAVGLTCGGTIHLFIEPFDW